MPRKRVANHKVASWYQRWGRRWNGTPEAASRVASITLSACSRLHPQRLGAVGKLGSNLGPNTDNLGPKPCTVTQNKARRTNQIAFLPLPWAQEVPSSNFGAPTNLCFLFPIT
jgi:hypothetical protein